MNEITISRKPSAEGLEEFSLEEINRFLATLPKTIYDYSMAEKKALRASKQAEINLKRILAKNMALARRDDELSAAEDRKAFAQNQPDTVEAEDANLEARNEYEVAVVRREYIENLFTSVRKAANIVLSETEMEERAQAYGNPNVDI